MCATGVNSSHAQNGKRNGKQRGRRGDRNDGGRGRNESKQFFHLACSVLLLLRILLQSSMFALFSVLQEMAYSMLPIPLLLRDLCLALDHQPERFSRGFPTGSQLTVCWQQLPPRQNRRGFDSERCFRRYRVGWQHSWEHSSQPLAAWRS